MVKVGKGGVFEKTVDDLLATADSDVKEDHFTNKTFKTFSDMTRMRSKVGEVGDDGMSSFTTPTAGGFGGLSVEKRRTSVLEAGLGMLMERQMTWGPLFNHPRTVVVGPNAAFQCAGTLGTLANKWEDKPSLDMNDDVSVFSSDVDQVIWVNLCGGDSQVPRTAYSLLEIGVVRFHHERRQGSFVPLTFGTARFYSGEGRAYAKQKTKAEFRALTSKLFWDKSDVEANVKNHDDKVVKPKLEFTGGKSAGNIEHIQAALVVLERLMRDRTTELKKLLNYNSENTKTQVQTDRMYKAAGSGVIPYAATDLDEDTRQPAVMPGHFDVDRIADVIQYVLLPSVEKKVKKSKSLRVHLSMPNPYADFDDDDDDDQNGDDDGISSLSGSDAEVFL